LPSTSESCSISNQQSRRLDHRHNWRHAAFKRSILAKQHTASIFCLAFDDEHILTGSSDHSALVWDINSGEPLRKLDAHQFAVWNVKVRIDHPLPSFSLLMPFPQTAHRQARNHSFL